MRALALDSKENVWVASNMDLRTPQPKLPEGISIMEQFKLITDHMVKYIEGPPARITGAVNMIRPDGTQPAPEGFTGPAESIPWGLNIDGNDDVWGRQYVGSFRCAISGGQHHWASARHEGGRYYPHFPKRQHPDGNRRVY